MTTNRLEIDPLIPTLVKQLFAGMVVIRVEPVPEGVSTYVYRIRCDQALYYLRILPEVNASFTPEALVHTLVRARGVRAPAIVQYEAYHPSVGRSLMVTTAIRGQALSTGAHPPTLKEILVEAGKDLALVNSIKVAGVGWIRRDATASAGLCAEQPTFSAWIEDEINGALHRLAEAQLVATKELDAIRAQITRADRLLGDGEAHLAHGDFDLTHIYHREGAYSGMIDFGEIRGAHRLYDLGHFQIENRDLLPYLLAGYAEQTALPADYQQQIDFATLLDVVHWLGRSLAKRRSIQPPLLAALRFALAALDG